MVDVRTVVYVSNADSHEICVVNLDPRDGNLEMIERVSVSEIVKPMTTNPTGSRLYAALASAPYSVNCFAIDRPSGKLQLLTTTPLPDRMVYLSIDRTGRYFFGASYHGDKISIHEIGPNGEVRTEPLIVMATGKQPHCIVTDPSNRFLFVSNLGDDAIQQFLFHESTGAIEPNRPAAVATQPGAGPRHIVFHQNRRFAFSTNELDGTVNTYLLAENGTLTLIESISTMAAEFKGKPWTADLHLTPTGQFLYSCDRSSSTVAAFSVNDETGKLTTVGIYQTEIQPRGFNIDPLGQFLVVAGEKSNRLSNYAIDRRTGELRHSSQIDVGIDPTWVEIVAISNA